MGRYCLLKVIKEMSRGRGDPKFEAYMAELETHVSSRRLYALNWLFLGDPREGRTWADAVLQNLMFLPHNPMSSSMPARVTSEAVGGCGWKLQIQTTGILGVTLHYINRLPSVEVFSDEKKSILLRGHGAGPRRLERKNNHGLPVVPSHDTGAN